MDAYLLAIMRAVFMAAPSSAAQVTAWPTGTCLLSGAAGGSVPVTSFQPACSPRRTANEATGAASSFSIRLLRGSRLPGIGILRGAAKHRRISRRPLRRHLLTVPRSRSGGPGSNAHLTQAERPLLPGVEL